jgi:hypothetical protein
MTNAASSITHHNFQREGFAQTLPDDSLTAYGWQGTPNSTHFTPDFGRKRLDI